MTARPRRDRLPTDAPAPPGHVLKCCLPVEAYEWLRLTAFQERRRMNSVALAALSAYQAEVDAGRTTVTVRASREGETTIGTIRLADGRYDWLRTTAFYARTSITALVVGALTRA